MRRTSRRQRRSLGGWQIGDGSSTPASYQPLLSLLTAIAYPGNPRSTICSKGDLPSWLQRLKVLIRLEERFNAQRIENPECDKKQKDVLRSRNLLDPLHSASPKTFGIIEADGTVEAESCRGLRHRRRRRRRHCLTFASRKCNCLENPVF